MPGRSFITRAGVLAVSLAGLLATGEIALRLLGRPFSPAEFQARNQPQTWDADGLASVPVAFDPALFWRRPLVAPPARQDAGEFLLLVLGDGHALGLADAKAAWPDALAHLIGLNETSRPLRVVNAAEPGYSSFQGLRRFEQLAGLRPDLACFAFGQSDAQLVRVPDAAYARRLEHLRPLAGSWLALRGAHASWAWLARGAAAPRVPVEEFRSSAAAFIERTRALGAVPIVVARGPALYRAALEAVAARAGAVLLADPGPGALAESLLDWLAGQGLVLSRRRHAAEVELGTASESQPELVAGWGPAELRPDGAPGRRFAREARLTLERLAAERGLALDVECAEGFAGRIEVDGGHGHDLSACRGRQWRRVEIGKGARERLAIRFVAEAGSEGGLLVHAVRLVPSDEPARIASDGPYAAELDLAEAEDARPELGPGFWSRETWSDGRQGRWTAREASLRLARRGAERGLIVDVSLQNPDNVTGCRVEANGVPVYAFRTRNGRHRFGVDIQRVAGRVVRVRLIVERTFVPGRAGDHRELGLFVHSVRLAASEVP